MGTKGRIAAVVGALGLLMATALVVTVPVASGEIPTRGYESHIPPDPTALVVFLHGCTQDGADAARGTRFHEAANARGVAVVYPNQNTFTGNLTAEYDGNDGRCWNWFLDDHMHRGSGEPAAIAAITEEVLEANPTIDRRRVYVAGLSAGADMTAVMGATYPDLFAAVGVISGCAYNVCTDVTGEAAYDEMQAAMAGAGSPLLPMPAWIGQGSTDMVSNAALDHSSLRQWLGTNDWIDNGELDGSVSPVPAAVVPHGPGGFAPPGDTDGLCVAPRRFPCAGGVGIQGNYPYTVEYYDDADGNPLIEHWLIHGLNHAYPNGSPEGSFTDPLGPDITTAVLDFFLAHPKPSTEVPTSLSFTAASEASGQYTDAAAIEVRLVDGTGAPVAGRAVTISLAGARETVETDGAGVAQWTPALTGEPGIHTVTAAFAGDGPLEPSDAAAQFRIEREDTSLSLSVDGRGAGRRLTARLADADTESAGVERRDITFMAGGVVIGTARTGDDGVATIDVPPAYRGARQTFTAAFAGDAFFVQSDA